MSRQFLGVIGIAALFASIAIAGQSYRGYSGAPGSNGRCASSCHGSSGGTISVSGFPDEYMPGETYEISITHSGGTSIRQFNGSARLNTGSDNAGVLAAVFNTSTYSVPVETNGIRLSSSSRDSASFSWTAPEAGTGEVRLYIAGLQGSYGGQNTNLTLISNEAMVGVKNDSELPVQIGDLANYPNPFNASTTIAFNLQTGEHVTITVYNLQGQLLDRLLDSNLSPGSYNFKWDAFEYPSGIYYYKLTLGDKTFSRRMTLLK